MNKPNFFILGAAKSGTTSLYYYLKQHPEIFMSPVKEPSFFCWPFQVVKNPVEYFQLFAKDGNRPIRGEASHVYLTHPDSPPMLSLLFPDAKFVVILRNPADRAYSLYHYMRMMGYEYIFSFEKALEIEEKRFNSKRFQKRCPHYFYNYLYFRSGLYAQQLQRYFSRFKMEQFHILSLEHLKINPLQTLKEIFRFLEVLEDFAPEIEMHNRSRYTSRWPKWQYFLRAWAGPGAQKLGLRFLSHKCRKMRKKNYNEIPPMKEQTRKYLMDQYHEDMVTLYKLTQISFL